MPPPPSPLLPDERPAAGAARLPTRYAGHFAPETVPGLLTDPHTRLAEQARIRTHPAVSAERPTAERLDAADIVITRGCGDACPVVPGRRYLDRPAPDPDGAPIAVVRDIRDAIDPHITELLTQLAP
ncbi:hypothetical protein HYE82_01145 [Streptomyces sp. BR123]|uniref:hypothetical protein n=1 Tax=Streptomyces sp. BR123 TaxID=2749828 RepID=UPI0015C4A150|nr:hypothetical protein [Streptomyces sp. BR123]NXY93050.1 hypothetical protein [Streptomyces sp. BR123]